MSHEPAHGSRLTAPGLLGLRWEPEANRLVIAPRVEVVTWVSEANVRCGASIVDVKARLKADGLEMRIWKRVGPAIWVTASPWLAAAPSAVEIDGTRMQPRVTADGDGVRAAVEFQASGEHEISFLPV
jgi:hypothetical protein